MELEVSSTQTVCIVLSTVTTQFVNWKWTENVNVYVKVSLVGGMHRYPFRGNWKLQLENTVDMYHVPFSHESTLSKEGKQFSRRLGDDAGSTTSEAGQATDPWEKREAWGAAENGHSYTGH